MTKPRLQSAEYAALTAAAVAWLLLITSQATENPAAHDHQMTMPMDPQAPMLMTSHDANSPGAMSLHAMTSPWMWSTMTVAMMLPATLGSLRTTAQRSLRQRRHRSTTIHLAGFLAVWLTLGAILYLASLPLHRVPANTTIAAAFLAAAAAWQLTPHKRRALNAHHRTLPLRPRGLRADRDVFHYGIHVGEACAISCTPMMLAALITPHPLPLMALTATIVICERYRYRPPVKTAAAILAITALITLAA